MIPADALLLTGQVASSGSMWNQHGELEHAHAVPKQLRLLILELEAGEAQLATAGRARDRRRYDDAHDEAGGDLDAVRLLADVRVGREEKHNCDNHKVPRHTQEPGPAHVDAPTADYGRQASAGDQHQHAGGV